MLTSRARLLPGPACGGGLPDEDPRMHAEVSRAFDAIAELACSAVAAGCGRVAVKIDEAARAITVSDDGDGSTIAPRALDGLGAASLQTRRAGDRVTLRLRSRAMHRATGWREAESEASRTGASQSEPPPSHLVVYGRFADQAAVAEHIVAAARGTCTRVWGCHPALLAGLARGSAAPGAAGLAGLFSLREYLGLLFLPGRVPGLALTLEGEAVAPHDFLREHLQGGGAKAFQEYKYSNANPEVAVSARICLAFSRVARRVYGTSFTLEYLNGRLVRCCGRPYPHSRPECDARDLFCVAVVEDPDGCVTAAGGGGFLAGRALHTYEASLHEKQRLYYFRGGQTLRTAGIAEHEAARLSRGLKRKREEAEAAAAEAEAAEVRAAVARAAAQKEAAERAAARAAADKEAAERAAARAAALAAASASCEAAEAKLTAALADLALKKGMLSALRDL